MTYAIPMDVQQLDSWQIIDGELILDATGTVDVDTWDPQDGYTATVHGRIAIGLDVDDVDPTTDEQAMAYLVEPAYWTVTNTANL